MEKHPFEKRYPFEKRKELADKLRARFPDKVPVIVNISPHDKILPALEKEKYLVDSSMPAHELMYYVKQQLKAQDDCSERALFYFVNDSIMNCADLIGHIHEAHAAKDGLLYVLLSSENTFGDTRSIQNT